MDGCKGFYCLVRCIIDVGGLVGVRIFFSVFLVFLLIFMRRRRRWGDEVEERGGRMVWYERWMWECVCSRVYFESICLLVLLFINDL